jgi:hypothetical protein
MNMDHKWDYSGRRQQKNPKKVYSIAALSVTNRTLTSLGLNTGLWAEKQAINTLSYGTTSVLKRNLPIH